MKRNPVLAGYVSIRAESPVQKTRTQGGDIQTYPLNFSKDSAIVRRKVVSFPPAQWPRCAGRGGPGGC